MKVLLASVAVALAGGGTPALPTKLPADVAGFAFGDTLAEIQAKCEKLGPRPDTDKPRFLTRPGWASCAGVRTGKAYMPAVSGLIFTMKDNSTVSIAASDVPMPTLMEYSRQIARSERAEVEGNHFCQTFADRVGGVCVDLETKILLLTIGG